MSDDDRRYVVKRTDTEWLCDLHLGTKKCNFGWEKTSAKALPFDRALADAICGLMRSMVGKHEVVEIDEKGMPR